MNKSYNRIIDVLIEDRLESLDEGPKSWLLGALATAGLAGDAGPGPGSVNAPSNVSQKETPARPVIHRHDILKHLKAKQVNKNYLERMKGGESLPSYGDWKEKVQSKK